MGLMNERENKMKRLIGFIVVLAVLALSVPWVAEFSTGGSQAFALDTLSVQTLSIEGIIPAYEAADSTGMRFLNNGETWLEVDNNNAAVCSLVVTSQVALWTSLPAGAAAANKIDTLAATTGHHFIGPFTQTSWNDLNGYVLVTPNIQSSVTIKAYKLR
jgi:hypothetical protein